MFDNQPQFSLSAASPQELPLPKLPEPFPTQLLQNNRDEFLASERYRDVVVDDLNRTWASFYPAVHGTSVDRALNIIKDGQVCSYGKLTREQPSAVSDNRSLNTDKLDISLGLHEYVFLNLGRVHPLDIHPVYFIFPNEIVEGDGVVASLREIVHFGALVSKEAEVFAQRADPKLTADGIRARNEKATEQFLKNSFQGARFITEVLPKFIQKEFEQVVHYSSCFEFPLTELQITRVGNEAVVMNSWEGPQVMVPDRLKLSEFQPALLITERDPIIKDRFVESGFPEDRIFSMNEVIGTYRRQVGLGDYTSTGVKYAYVNLALRDLVLLAPYNRARQSFPQSMNGFKNRV